VNRKQRSVAWSILALAIGVILFAREAPIQSAPQSPAGGASPVIDKNVQIPMRDGVMLGADIYRPSATGKFPVMLSRTPYNKNGQEALAKFFVEHGYAVVVVDSRGLNASKGEWHPYTDEGRDGYDTQQWVGQQPWSDGKVGMFGRSYPGYTQVAPAPLRSQYVKAIMPEAAQSSNFDAIWSTNGIYHLALGLSWGTGQEAIAKGQPRPSPSWVEVMHHLPLKSSMERIGVHSKFVADTLAHETYDDFWKAMSIQEKYADMDVPAFHLTGWYDDLTHETISNFVNMRKQSRSEHARRWQKLLVGPWGHGVRTDSKYGDLDFGPNMATDLRNLHLHWYDYHLKGTQNGLDKEAPIRIFVMGDNVWRDEQEWPLARAQATPFYLHSGGELSAERPGGEPPDRYTYDPADPTPTHGGNMLMHILYGPGTKDQRAVEERPDVLSYTTAPLVEDTEVTGPLSVRLWAASDAPDTDFVARLVDVHPSGFAQNLADGIIRARYRNGAVAEPIEPGQAYEYTIDLWATANVFKAGHAIRVDIASASFPRWDRNPNTGAPLGQGTELRPARQTILHDAEHPSQIVLPIVPR